MVKVFIISNSVIATPCSLASVVTLDHRLLQEVSVATATRGVIGETVEIEETAESVPPSEPGQTETEAREETNSAIVTRHHFPHHRYM